MTREEALTTWLPVISMGIDNMPELKEALDMAIEALKQEPSRDLEEIKEIIECDADAETKCKMISSIVNGKPHYFTEQEPCDDAISLEDAIEAIASADITDGTKPVFSGRQVIEMLKGLDTIKPQEPKTGHCKDCKYFEYDNVARPGSGIPIIVAHEICSKWGNGCKTSEDGYCFLFEPQESEERT